MAFSVPSPAAVFAARVLVKKYRVYCVLAKVPFLLGPPFVLAHHKQLDWGTGRRWVASPEFSSNHGRLTAKSQADLFAAGEAVMGQVVGAVALHRHIRSACEMPLRNFVASPTTTSSAIMKSQTPRTELQVGY